MLLAVNLYSLIKHTFTFLANVLTALFAFKSPLCMLQESLSALSGQSGLCFHFHNSILGAEPFHFDKI